MTLTLSTYANGDSDYIAKLNSDNLAIEGAVNQLQTLSSGAASSSLSAAAFFPGLFGTIPTVIGAGSYGCTGSGTNLTVAPGYAWSPAGGAVVQLIAPAVLNFAGQSAATYYISIDNSGNPSFSTTSTAAFFSVVWTGTAFGTITQLAITLPTAAVLALVAPLVGVGASPSAAAGAGAGTGPTVTVVGTDRSGKITVVTGTSPGTNDVIATITFALPFTSTNGPFVDLTPASKTAIAADVYVNETDPSWTLNAGGTGLAASTTYVWNYLVGG